MKSLIKPIIIAAMVAGVSLQAAQVAPEKIAPAKKVWGGAEIKTKAAAATILTKKDECVRALEVLYGCEFDEREQKLKHEVREGCYFDEPTQTLVKTRYIRQALSKDLRRLIASYL